jgi:hypothetical protein
MEKLVFPELERLESRNGDEYMERKSRKSYILMRHDHCLFLNMYQEPHFHLYIDSFGKLAEH